MRHLLLSLSFACTVSKTEEADPGDTRGTGSDETTSESDAPDENADQNGNTDGGAGGEGADDDGESMEDCESELGTFEGQVLLDLDWGSGPEVAPFARVTATPNTGESITISTDEEGRFTTPLPIDTYLIMAEGSRCVSEQFSIELEPCETETHTIRLVDCMLGETDTGLLDEDEESSGDEGADTTGDGEGGPADGEDSDTTAGEDGESSGGEGSDATGDDDGGPVGGEDSDTTGDDDGGPAGGVDTDTTGGEDTDEGGVAVLELTESTCVTEIPDSFDVTSLAWSGDVLVVGVGYGGCEDGRHFTPCWGGTWDRGIPAGTTIDLDMAETDEMCMMYVMEDIYIDVRRIIDASATIRDTAPFQIRVGDMSIEYRP